MQAPITKEELFKIEKSKLLTALDQNLTISITDKFGRITYANDSFCKLIGVKAQNIVGETNHLLKSRLHKDELYKNLWQTILKSQPWKGILYHKLSANKVLWLHTTITPFKDENGAETKYLAVYNNITDYCNIKFSDNVKEVKQKALLKKISGSILPINDRGKIINATDEFYEDEHHLISGAYIFDFIDTEYHAGIKSVIKKVFAKGKPSQYQFKTHFKNENKALYILEIYPVFNASNNVVFANISIQKQAVDLEIISELKGIETKYSSIFQSINVGIIVVTDSKGNIIEWNKGAEAAFCYSESEVLGKSLTILMSEKRTKHSVKKLLRVKDKLHQTNEGETIEMIGLKKNGEEFPVQFAVSSWYCEKERYYCAIMLDISKRKHLENKLKQKTKDLELFLYRSSHDLKAPLTSAEGLLNLIKEEKNEERIKFLIDMLSSSLKTGKLLLDGLAFTSSISKKKRQVSKIDFKTKIDKIIDTLRGLENFNAINFDIKIQQNTPFYSNKELLQSVFQNLIQNAINYSKPKSENFIPTIKIHVAQQPNEVHISVSDNGFGISKLYLNKIFELYYRSPNQHVQGTGLGLYIVKSIVEDLNGKITVSSKLHHGTTFSVIIPNTPKP
jgi:PAS domain S-box-containing protein